MTKISRGHNKFFPLNTCITNPLLIFCYQLVQKDLSLFRIRRKVQITIRSFHRFSVNLWGIHLEYLYIFRFLNMIRNCLFGWINGLCNLRYCHKRILLYNYSYNVIINHRWSPRAWLIIRIKMFNFKISKPSSTRSIGYCIFAKHFY